MSPGHLIAVRADGTVEIWPLDAQPKLEVLKDIVGGYIEAVPWFDRLMGHGVPALAEMFKNEPCLAFCNEEGKLKGLPYNDLATRLWWTALRRRDMSLLHQGRMTDTLCGNVAIATGEDILRVMMEGEDEE